MADQAVQPGSETWKRMKAAADANTGALEAENQKKTAAEHADFATGARSPGTGWTGLKQLVMPTPMPDPAAAAEAQKAQMQNSLTSQARAMKTHEALQSGKLQWDELPTKLQQDLINSPDVGHMYQNIPE
jgi:hypothetical protein